MFPQPATARCFSQDNWCPCTHIPTATTSSKQTKDLHRTQRRTKQVFPLAKCILCSSRLCWYTRKAEVKFNKPTLERESWEVCSTVTASPKINPGKAIAFQEYSDFLLLVQIASKYLESLKVYNYPTQIKPLVEKLLKLVQAQVVRKSGKISESWRKRSIYIIWSIRQLCPLRG